MKADNHQQIYTCNKMNFKNWLLILTCSTYFFVCFSVYSNETEELLSEEQIKFNNEVDKCKQAMLETGFVQADNKMIDRFCQTKMIAKKRKTGRFAERLFAEKITELNPFVITPHEISYIMPFTITDNFNREPYNIFSEDSDDPSIAPEERASYYASEMQRVEAKYQISFKVPLNSSSIFFQGDAIYFGMTLQAWWQLYSDEISKPFRETNYKPEIFYLTMLPWTINDRNIGFAVNIEHQSNGQFQGISRSWNRIHLTFAYDSDNWATAIKLWHRFEEPEKSSALDPSGDDNPDIEDYLGHYEIKSAYAFDNNHKLSSNIRKNWRTGNGSIELNYTFPMSGRLRGLVQYFSGYGESLIDYNHKQQKLGLGIALTDIF